MIDFPNGGTPVKNGGTFEGRPGPPLRQRDLDSAKLDGIRKAAERTAMIANVSSMRRAWMSELADPRRNVEDECGHPREGLSPQQYQELFDGDPVSARVVEVYPKECWQTTPQVFEVEDEEVVTPFEAAVKALDKGLRSDGLPSWHEPGDDGGGIWEALHRGDVLSGIGQYGVLLLGIDDGLPLSTPAKGVTEEGSVPEGKDAKGEPVAPTANAARPYRLEGVWNGSWFGECPRDNRGYCESGDGGGSEMGAGAVEEWAKGAKEQDKAGGSKTIAFRKDVKELLSKSFGGEMVHEKGSIYVKSGPKYLDAKMDSKTRTIDVSFGSVDAFSGSKASAKDVLGDRTGQAAKELQPGSMALMRQFQEMLKGAKKSGISISYQADARRDKVYSKALEGAGFKRSSSSPHTSRAVWRPTGNAATIANAEAEWPEYTDEVGAEVLFGDGAEWATDIVDNAPLPSPKKVMGSETVDAPSSPEVDGDEEDEPVKEAEVQAPVTPRKLLYVRAYAETHAPVVQWESNPLSPRYGQPVMYQVYLHASGPKDTAPVGSPMSSTMVHWTRVVHLADVWHQASGNVRFAAPRMRPVLSRLLDLKKLYGGSAEMYWRGAFPGISIEPSPNAGGGIGANVDALRDMVEEWSQGLDRALYLDGLTAKVLSPTVVGPESQVRCQIEALCIKLAVPIRVFMGSERGELASGQDDAAWNDRLKHRNEAYTTPRVIVPFFDRLIFLGCLPEPSSYRVFWPDLTSTTAQEQASLAGSRTAAMAQYVGAGLEALMAPKDFYTRELGYDDEEAEAILEAAMQGAADGQGDDEALAPRPSGEEGDAAPPGPDKPKPPPPGPNPPGSTPPAGPPKAGPSPTGNVDNSWFSECPRDSSGYCESGDGGGGGSGEGVPKAPKDYESAIKATEAAMASAFGGKPSLSGDNKNRLQVGSEGRSVGARVISPREVMVSFKNEQLLDYKKISDKDLQKGRTASGLGSTEVQPGTITLMRQFQDFAGQMREKGLSISFTADPRRNRVYEKALKSKGFERANPATDRVAVWRPARMAANSADDLWDDEIEALGWAMFDADDNQLDEFLIANGSWFSECPRDSSGYCESGDGEGGSEKGGGSSGTSKASVTAALSKAFGGKVKEDGNVITAEFRGRNIKVRVDEDTKTADVSFEHTQVGRQQGADSKKDRIGSVAGGGSTGVGKAELQPGTMDMMRGFQGFLAEAKASGLAVTFQADPRRAKLYEREMKRAGFEQKNKTYRDGKTIPGAFRWVPTGNASTWNLDDGDMDAVLGWALFEAEDDDLDEFLIANESWFASCPRDDRGRCEAGDGGGSGPGDSAARTEKALGRAGKRDAAPKDIDSKSLMKDIADIKAGRDRSPEASLAKEIAGIKSGRRSPDKSPEAKLARDIQGIKSGKVGSVVKADEAKLAKVAEQVATAKAKSAASGKAKADKLDRGWVKGFMESRKGRSASLKEPSGSVWARGNSRVGNVEGETDLGLEADLDALLASVEEELGRPLTDEEAEAVVEEFMTSREDDPTIENADDVSSPASFFPGD